MGTCEVRISFTLRVEGPGCSTSDEAILQRIAALVQMELPARCGGAMLEEAFDFEISPLPPREGA